MDGSLLDASNYVAQSGSTVVTLKNSYVENLALGKHTITFHYKDGACVSTEFKVDQNKNSKSPKTGDDFNPTPWLAVMGVSLAVVAVIVIRKKKQH